MTSLTTPVHAQALIVSTRTAPSLFNFNSIAIRAIVDTHGNPWFAAVDVCKALEINNSRQALKKLDEDEKDVISSDTLGGGQSLASVNEAGLYELIFRSRKAEAKSFKRWVKQVVLPSIRADGFYVKGEERLLTACTSQAEVDDQVVAATARVNELLAAKMARLKAEHVEEREARAVALKLMSRRPSRRKRRSNPPEVLR